MRCFSLPLLHCCRRTPAVTPHLPAVVTASPAFPPVNLPMHPAPCTQVSSFKRPAKLLELYEFEGCPYCRKVKGEEGRVVT